MLGVGFRDVDEQLNLAVPRVRLSRRRKFDSTMGFRHRLANVSRLQLRGLSDSDALVCCKP